MGAPKDEAYQGFEQGPIRPPSEAQSLLIRVSRNCPWNRCTFCPVYKGAKFSTRPVEHVKRDIDAVHRHLEKIRSLCDASGRPSRDTLQEVLRQVPAGEEEAFNAAFHWFRAGMRNVFLQDANALFIRPPHLIEILTHLRACFPHLRRVTCYARSQTVAAWKEDDLRAVHAAGLDRVHIGLESGSEAVLERVHKGSTKAQHIVAGQKVKAAGMELSEYYMPGLGGQDFWETHARESAEVLNQINPDFIRLRSLAIPNHVPLFEEWCSGRFKKCPDVLVAREIRLFLESLQGITSRVKSDHILNLFGDLEGRLPEAQADMLTLLDAFLSLPPEEQALYQVGRRMGAFYSLTDLNTPQRRAMAQSACREYGITPENVDTIIDELMKRFI